MSLKCCVVSICVLFINSHLIAVMPAGSVRPLTTFAHIFVRPCGGEGFARYRQLQSSKTCHDSCSAVYFMILDSVASCCILNGKIQLQLRHLHL